MSEQRAGQVTGGIEVIEQEWRRGSRWRPVIGFLRTKPLGTAGALIVLTIVVLAIGANVIAPYDPTALAGTRLQAPSADFWFGTDKFGRDLFSRIVFGSRTSLEIGFISVALGTSTGVIVGLISGYWAGKTIDNVLQRIMDSLMAFPALVLALVMVAMLGADIKNIMIAISVVTIPGVSRVVRGATMSVKAHQYVEAAQAMGASTERIILNHILPNVMAPILILATARLGTAILTEASLSYLGLGTPPPTPSWGQMLAQDSRDFYLTQPYLAIFPGLAITLAVLGFNLFGDALRDVLDPRLRGTS